MFTPASLPAPHPTTARLSCDSPPDWPASPTHRRGNPDLNLSPRCGAKARSGCPCRAPAVHGKRRCRMHGGRSTGPRTPEGLERLRATRTTHGCLGARSRAVRCYFRLRLRRATVAVDALHYAELLPPELFLRLHQRPAELLPAAIMPRTLTAAQARAMRQAEAAALAPWEQAIAAVRQAERERRAAAKAHAPVRRRGRRSGRPAGTGQGDADSPARPLAPDSQPAAAAGGAAADGGGARPTDPGRGVRPATASGQLREIEAELHAPARPGGAHMRRADPAATPHAPDAARTPPAPLPDLPLAPGAQPDGDATRPGPTAAQQAKGHAPVRDRRAPPPSRDAAARPQAPDRRAGSPFKPAQPARRDAGRQAAIEWKRAHRLPGRL